MARADLTTTYTNNAYGQPLTQTDPAGNTTYYSYDQYGDPTSADRFAGRHDLLSITISITTNPNDPDNGDLLSTTDPLGSTTSFTYDSAGDVLSTTTTLRGTTTNTYDQYGNLLTTTTPQGVTTTNTYDNDGNLLTSQWTWVNPSNSSNTSTMTTTNTYDGNGNLTQTVAPDGTTSTTYNPDGQVTRSVDALGGVTTTVYDANGRAIQTTTPDGMVTDTVYNGQGQVIYTDDPHMPGEPCDGTHTTYDQAGNVIGTERLANVVITVTHAADLVERADLGRPASSRATSTTYDAAGRVVQTVDASGVITNNIYDNVGDLIEATGDCQWRDPTRRPRLLTPMVRQHRPPMRSETRPSTSTMPPARSRRPYSPTARSIIDQYNPQGEKIAETDQKWQRDAIPI